MSCASYNCAICNCKLDIRDRQIMICTFDKGIESVCMRCEGKVKEYCSANGGSMTLEDYEKLNESGNLDLLRKLCKKGVFDNE